MKERWKYLGTEVPLGIHSSVNGKKCYRFRYENIAGGITLYVPVSKYWASAYVVTG